MEALIDLVKKEVFDRSKEIDSENEHDWTSLVYGWAIAKGLAPETAFEFAWYITTKKQFEWA